MLPDINRISFRKALGFGRAGEDACPTAKGFKFRSGELFNVQSHALGKRGNARRTSGEKALQKKGNGECYSGHRRGKIGSP